MGNRLTPFYILAIVLVLSAGLALYFSRSRPARPQTTPITQEAKEYVRNLRLSEVALKATESYVKQTITEIDGKITNAGDRNIRSAEVICIFYDVYGQVVLRERVPIIKTLLKPGETRPFRLPFDDMPESWNQQAPQLVIASIVFA